MFLIKKQISDLFSLKAAGWTNLLWKIKLILVFWLVKHLKKTIALGDKFLAKNINLIIKFFGEGLILILAFSVGCENFIIFCKRIIEINI